MIATRPEQVVELLDQAFNERDLEALLGLYEQNAAVVTEPGKMARGASELRTLFAQVFTLGQSAKQIKTHVIEVDGIALFLSRWTLEGKAAGEEVSSPAFDAVTVLRKQADGSWKAVIDNQFGRLVLGS